MKKLIIATVSVVACSVMVGCMSSAVSKGGTYANLPDPKPDEYQIHWENQDKTIQTEAVVFSVFKVFEGGDKAPWMLRDQENRNFFGIRNYSLESKARNAALYKACQQSKCDALIGAMYEVETEDYILYSVSKCKVTGWPARITGIEKVSNKVKK